MHKKLPGTTWLLPNAPLNTEAGTTAWYRPHDLPSPLKPRAPTQAAEEVDDTDKEEDEAGILESVAYLDSLVDDQVNKRRVDPKRILVGGFSQGCAVAMTFGLVGRWKDKVGGVFGLSGYLPSIAAVDEALKTDRLSDSEGLAPPKWFFAHGMRDMLVSISLFASGQERLRKQIDPNLIEGHIYPDLAHTIAGAEIRDIWLWMSGILEGK